MPFVGQVLIGVAAVLTAVTVILKSPPVRWLWRRNITEPFRAFIAEIVDERLDARPVTNGWGQEAVKAIAEQVGADVPSPRPPPARDED